MNHPLNTQQWVNLCHQLTSTARTIQKYLERKIKEEQPLNKEEIAAQIKAALESGDYQVVNMGLTTEQCTSETLEVEESVEDLNRHVRHLIRSHGRVAVRQAFNTNFPK